MSTVQILPSRRQTDWGECCRSTHRFQLKMREVVKGWGAHLGAVHSPEDHEAVLPVPSLAVRVRDDALVAVVKHAVDLADPRGVRQEEPAVGQAAQRRMDVSVEAVHLWPRPRGCGKPRAW